MYQPNTVVLNRFTIQERLAFGAFSVVYRAFDDHIQKDICLKQEKLDEEGGQTMIEHEFHVAKSFDSPFLCKSYDFFLIDNNKFVSMELLDDNLINIRRKRKNPPSVPMLINIAIQTLKGLAVMHQKNMIHSDIKPSNFAVRLNMNQSSYDIVLFDFGLSQKDDEDPQITEYRNKLVRNPRYLSIHTHLTNQWTQTDDIYSLIYSLSDFCNDGLPWDGRTTNNLVFEIKNNYDLKLLLPPELHVLIENVEQPANIIIPKLETVLNSMARNLEEEIHYIIDPKDPDLKPKKIKYIFEKGSKEKFTNQHSA